MEKGEKLRKRGEEEGEMRAGVGRVRNRQHWVKELKEQTSWGEHDRGTAEGCGHKRQATDRRVNQERYEVK